MGHPPKNGTWASIETITIERWHKITIKPAENFILDVFQCGLEIGFLTRSFQVRKQGKYSNSQRMTDRTNNWKSTKISDCVQRRATVIWHWALTIYCSGILFSAINTSTYVKSYLIISRFALNNASWR